MATWVSVMVSVEFGEAAEGRQNQVDERGGLRTRTRNLTLGCTAFAQVSHLPTALVGAHDKVQFVRQLSRCTCPRHTLFM